MRHFLIFPLLLSCSASATAQTPQGDALFSLLNQPVSSALVENFDQQYRLTTYGSTSRWSYTKGIEYDTEGGRIRFITLGAYKDGEVRKTFMETLPLELRWGMPKAEVERLLGPDRGAYHYDRNQDLLVYYDKQAGTERLNKLILIYKDYSKLSSLDSLLAGIKGENASNMVYLKNRTAAKPATSVASSANPFATTDPLCSALASIISAVGEGKASTLGGKILPGAVRASAGGSSYVVVLLSATEADSDAAERAMEEWRKKVADCLPSFRHGQSSKGTNDILFGDGYILTDYWFSKGDTQVDIKQQAGADDKTDVVLRVQKKEKTSGEDED